MTKTENLTTAEKESLERALAQSAAGETVDLGGFAQYVEDDVEGGE